jgi:hypothetical protein
MIRRKQIVKSHELHESYQLDQLETKFSKYDRQVEMRQKTPQSKELQVVLQMAKPQKAWLGQDQKIRQVTFLFVLPFFPISPLTSNVMWHS